MPNIVIEDNVLAKRGLAIRKLISPLVGKLDSREPKFKKIPSATSVAIAAYSNQTAADFRDWRFNTKFQNYKGNYFEVWKSLDKKQDKWFLEKAYLQIFKIINAYQDEKEYICLHSDPEETGTSSSKFKKGPHFHVKIADENSISRAHLAIGGINVDEIVKSNNELFATMELGIEIILYEILSRKV